MPPLSPAAESCEAIDHITDPVVPLFLSLQTVTNYPEVEYASRHQVTKALLVWLANTFKNIYQDIEQGW